MNSDAFWDIMFLSACFLLAARCHNGILLGLFFSPEEYIGGDIVMCMSGYKGGLE
jgi:hypothetical protein